MYIHLISNIIIIKKLHLSFIILLFGVTLSGYTQQTKWVSEENGSHSSIGFSIDHLVISETTGEFENYRITVLSDRNDFTDAKIDFETKVNSTKTRRSTKVFILSVIVNHPS